MSLREVRDLCEQLRFLNYGQTVCAEHFRLPNFDLVVDILIWLTKRFSLTSLQDQDEFIIEKPEDSETSRLIFLRDMVKFFARNAQIILNSKKLYKANFEAGAELKRITVHLKDSLLADNSNAFYENYGDTSANRSMVESHLERARQIIKKSDIGNLANLIVESTEAIAESLDKELLNTKHRSAIIDRRLQLDEVDQIIKSQQSEFMQLNVKLDKSIADVENDLTDVEAKLERKRTELLHAKERLEALQAIDPSHKAELDQLNEELDQTYDTYVSRYRCISYLEYELKKCALADSKIDRPVSPEQVSGDDDEDNGSKNRIQSTKKLKSQLKIPDLTDDIQKSIDDVIKSRRAPKIGSDQQQQNKSVSDSIDINTSIEYDDDDDDNDIIADEEYDDDDDDVLGLNTDEEFSSLFINNNK